MKKTENKDVNKKKEEDKKRKISPAVTYDPAVGIQITPYTR